MVGAAGPPPVDPLATKPEVTEDEYGVTRRQFFDRGLGAIFGIFLAQFGIASLAFMWPRLASGGFGSKVNAGKLTDIEAEVVLPDGRVQPLFVSSAQSYLLPFRGAVADSQFGDSPIIAGGFMALWQRCVHLGCRVPWCESSQGFECPCHGSKYNSHGEYEDGPAPRNLDRFVVEASPDGDLIIDTGTVIQTSPRVGEEHSIPTGALVPLILATAEAEVPVGAPIGLGTVMLALAVLTLIAWLTYVLGQTRVRNRRREAAPANTSPFLSDDELETTRLNSVLGSALIASAVLAIVMPVYYLAESGRQAHAVEVFGEIAIERGEHWYEEFGCFECHALDGGGGGAEFIEGRSGLSTTWVAPALNDIAYRYDSEETLYWLTWGRQGSPMPAWGTEGGGPLNGQQLDELVAYLDHIQITQREALEQVDGRVERELRRIENAEATIQTQIDGQRAELEAIAAAPAYLEAVKDFPEQLGAIIAGPSTCTVESAALIGRACESEASDGDRDGIGDAAETAVAQLIIDLVTAAPASEARDILGTIDDGGAFSGISFDPSTKYTNFSGNTGIEDLDELDTVLAEFETVVRDVQLTVDSSALLTEAAETGLVFLEDALARKRYAFDSNQLAADGFAGNLAQTRRAIGLYNSYCARCHTAGYSAGVAYTTEAGSGAMGPSLREGRSAVQFPSEADHLDFIINGSENGQGYGVNGIGRGWMPGFGATLTQEDLMLIVRLERVLP